jgi:hypothetical protein
MNARIDIGEVSLVADAAVDSEQARRVGADLGHALQAEWQAAGQRADLRVDRLEVNAPRAEIARAGFARDPARSTVRRVLRQWRGE